MDQTSDAEASWLLDQTPFPSSPLSPFLSFSHDLPSSPLWVFPDFRDNVSALAGSSQCISSDPERAIESPSRNNDKTRAVLPLSGLLPLENPDSSCMAKERMMQALRYLKDSTEQHILAQVWAPVKIGSRYALTTSGQPFVLDPLDNWLHQYRMLSLVYTFSVDEANDGELGLPGRVFQQKQPEWTPNVQYYSSKEYLRLVHALKYNVRGTLALPVFELSGESCIGVVELIMTCQKINYAPDFDKVCRALEAVNLRSSEILNHSNTQICNEGHQNSLAEILKVLAAVCETHKLPLAQTWVPCRHHTVPTGGGDCLKKTCSSFNRKCIGQVSISTCNAACYVIDPHVWGFLEACAEHHLQTGQGVAGRAFSSHNACFCSDVSQFSKKEYPLVHYARLFGLTSCFAICLRTAHTRNDIYVLEFFMPPIFTDSGNLKASLEPLLGTMKQHFCSLRFAPVEEQAEKISLEVIKSSTGEKPDFIMMSEENEPMVKVGALKDGSNAGGVSGSHQIVSGLEDGTTKETAKIKPRKSEKSISIELLQQYFAGSLKEAARSLGVCPTTMKRICRQHGIARWPSRKIKKVNRSLSKLKHVIDSVQGAERVISLSAFASRPGSNPFPATERSVFDKENAEMHVSETPGSNGHCDQEPLIQEQSEIPREAEKTVTIKAAYRENIIRFKISVASGVAAWHAEVAKRLNLGVGNFAIKYLDDDGEWVLIACGADVEECIEVSRSSSGGNVVRLLVHEGVTNFGSSCEGSSWE